MSERRKQMSWQRPVDPRSGKPYTELTTAELRRATQEFDEPMVLERKSRPLSPKERVAYRRAMKRGRPRVGEGARRVLITVERGLLRRADAYAKRQQISRSELIARGLEAVIGSAA